jgi:hypothetical protein
MEKLAMKIENESQQILAYFVERLELIEEQLKADNQVEVNQNKLNKALSEIGKMSLEMSPEVTTNLQGISWVKFNGLTFASIGPGFSLADVKHIWLNDLHGIRSEAEKILKLSRFLNSEQ